jgi:hypothetical protein
MTFIFIFQALLPFSGNRWRTQLETQRRLRPPSQPLNSSTSIAPDGQENADRVASS